ncbi:MAG: hypothetical protein ACJ763_12090 [Bdellovibrionia bacterium]
MSKPFFLAKSGQIFGPFERSEIETLRESGDYEKYTWFWDETVARWQPIDPPPAPPRSVSQPGRSQDVATPSAPQAQAATAPAQSSWSVSEAKLRSISVLCHDQQTVASGTLAHVTDAGCEFIVQTQGHGHSTSPEFQTKLPVLLHLLDLTSGRSMNVSGRVGKVERRDGAWVYRIHWKHCPQLLSERGSSVSQEAKI